jgi:ketosteroid isomerase-like protein
MLTYESACELFERRRLAWLREDLEEYFSLWAEEMTFRSPAHPQPLRGKPAFAELVRLSMGMMQPVSFEVKGLAVQGDLLFAEWRIAARHRASKRVIEWEGMSSARIDGGLITEWREYWNPADLAG